MTTISYADAESEQLPAANTVIYTCPATVSSAHVIFANCTNEDAVDTTLVVNIVKSGGAAAVTNIYFPSTTITAGTSDPLTELIGVVLKSGDFISAIAGAADKLNLKFSIKEIRS